MSDMKKVVVFGASGDTGKYFIDYLLNNYKEEKIEIIAVGTKDTSYFKKVGIKYFKVDISQKNHFNFLPTDIYAVVHLAGAMPAKMEGYVPSRYIDVNITGTLNILDYCRYSNADRILYSQSFGDIKDHADFDPLLKVDLPRKFSFKSDHTIYVISKNAAADLIEHYHQMFGLKKFIFRLPNIYMYTENDKYFVDGKEEKVGYRVIIDQAIKGDDLEVWGDPNRVKDMVYVKDLCLMLSNALFIERNKGYYNVGTGIGTSLMDQIKGIAMVFNPKDKKSNLIMCPDKRNAPEYIMDITNAVEELNYKPMYSYIEMLKDFKKEMQLNRFID